LPAIRTYLPFAAAALLMSIVVVCIYPYYQYYVDTDATAYLTIAQRYADGEYFKAINGYWSPWSCWLVALLIKAGHQPFVSAIFVNAVGAGCFLFICQSFFNLFNIPGKRQYIWLSTISLFLAYAVFKQLFDDIWECFFLLAGLRILLMPGFTHRKDLWVWLGISGGFAYYAKAYAFPFFMLNTLCCVFYLTEAWHKSRRADWMKISAVSIAVMMVIALPWIAALHEKYGIWITSTAGTLNLSWYPVGHPFYKKGIEYLLPPVYANSPSYWEDPWMVNGVTPHFWNSGALFLRQIARVVYNLTLFVKCLNEMSPLLFPAVVLSLAVLLSKKLQTLFGKRYTVVALSFLLFPLGFVLINFESRYIWYMLFPGLLLVIVALQYAYVGISNNKINTAITLLAAVSFLAWPVWDMKQMYKSGEREYIMAKELQKHGVKGSFTANVVFGQGNDLEEVSRLAYFSGNPYYNLPKASISYEELLKDIRRHKVNYFFYYHKDEIANRNFVLYNEHGLPFPSVTGEFGNLTIFKIN
jgi:hypothetical protein